MTATITKQCFNGHSMGGDLRKVLVCSPGTAGWNRPEYSAHWRDLGFLHAPDFEKAQSQHEALCRELKAAGVEVWICHHRRIFLWTLFTRTMHRWPLTLG